MNSLLKNLGLILATLWLGMTATIDFLVLPQAFRTIPDLWLAGTLGMRLFNLFNPLELALSIMIALTLGPNLRSKMVWCVVTTLVIISSSYYFYLTPKLSFLTREIIEVKESGALEAFSRLSLEHDFYHRLYIKLDSLKFILILGLIVYSGMKKQEIKA